MQHFCLAPNNPIFSAHIPSSDSMNATYFIKSTTYVGLAFGTLLELLLPLPTFLLWRKSKVIKI